MGFLRIVRWSGNSNPSALLPNPEESLTRLNGELFVDINMFCHVCQLPPLLHAFQTATALTGGERSQSKE